MDIKMAYNNVYSGNEGKSWKQKMRDNLKKNTKKAATGIKQRVSDSLDGSPEALKRKTEKLRAKRKYLEEKQRLDSAKPDIFGFGGEKSRRVDNLIGIPAFNKPQDTPKKKARRPVTITFR